MSAERNQKPTRILNELDFLLAERRRAHVELADTAARVKGETARLKDPRAMVRHHPILTLGSAFLGGWALSAIITNETDRIARMLGRREPFGTHSAPHSRVEAEQPARRVFGADLFNNLVGSFSTSKPAVDRPVAAHGLDFTKLAMTAVGILAPMVGNELRSLLSNWRQSGDSLNESGARAPRQQHHNGELLH